MFNEPFDQQTADLAVLNGKLRRHKGGKLNVSAPIALQYEGHFKHEAGVPTLLTKWTIVVSAIFLFFLIRNLFPK